jgi:hypothetical protein
MSVADPLARPVAAPAPAGAYRAAPASSYRTVLRRWAATCSLVTWGEMAKPGLREQGVQFFKHVVPAVIKPLHALWHEVIGFLFLACAVVGFFKGVWPNLSGGSGDPDSLGKALVGIVFTAIMAWYGVTSLWRARKITRS